MDEKIKKDIEKLNNLRNVPYERYLETIGYNNRDELYERVVWLLPQGDEDIDRNEELDAMKNILREHNQSYIYNDNLDEIEQYAKEGYVILNVADSQNKQYREMCHKIDNIERDQIVNINHQESGGRDSVVVNSALAQVADILNHPLSEHEIKVCESVVDKREDVLLESTSNNQWRTSSVIIRIEDSVAFVKKHYPTQEQSEEKNNICEKLTINYQLNKPDIFVVTSDSELQEFCKEHNIECLDKNSMDREDFEKRIAELMDEKGYIAIADHDDFQPRLYNQSVEGIEPFQQTIYIGNNKESYFGMKYEYTTKIEELAHIAKIALSDKEQLEENYKKCVLNFKNESVERDVKKTNPDYEELPKEKQIEMFQNAEYGLTKDDINKHTEKRYASLEEKVKDATEYYKNYRVKELAEIEKRYENSNDRIEEEKEKRDHDYER